MRIPHFLLLSIFMSSVSLHAQTASPLRELASKAGINFGCAVGGAFPGDTAYTRIIRQECNIVVSENDMKWGSIHPQQNQYNWARADSLVAFAQRNNMKIRGHCLVWHNQAPSWLTSNNFTKAQMLAAMQSHIAAVVGRYKGKIAEWDVVNEAIDDGSAVYRNSFWLQKVGSEYIDSAFVYAHAADPAALLFYNDYSAENMGTKSQKVYDLVSGMKSRGVPVHGVGFQCHFTLNGFNTADIERNIKRLAALGLAIDITELDIRIQLPADSGELAAQGRNYRDLLALFLKNRPACRSFLTWGITDRYSWIPGTFSGTGAALVFDETYAPKPAYAGLSTALGTAAAVPPWIGAASSGSTGLPLPPGEEMLIDLSGRKVPDRGALSGCFIAAAAARESSKSLLFRKKLLHR